MHWAQGWGEAVTICNATFSAGMHLAKIPMVDLVLHPDLPGPLSPLFPHPAPCFSAFCPRFPLLSPRFCPPTPARFPLFPHHFPPFSPFFLWSMMYWEGYLIWVHLGPEPSPHLCCNLPSQGA